jgi:hypothetical protein
MAQGYSKRPNDLCYAWILDRSQNLMQFFGSADIIS